MIADPRVSEAHALVSLRHRELRLLALRGPLAIEGQEVDSVKLEHGLVVELADGLTMTVEQVELPSHVLMLVGVVNGPSPLWASMYSLSVVAEAVHLIAGYVPEAAGHLWYSGARLWICLRGQPAEPLQGGARWTVEGCGLKVFEVPLAGASDTIDESRHRPTPKGCLVLVAHYTSVHVQRDAGTAVITGRPANLVSELVRFDRKPVPWELVARQIWGDRDRELLRDSFDTTRARLRRQLRDLSVRDDLVKLDGAGNVELVLYPGDRTVDRT